MAQKNSACLSCVRPWVPSPGFPPQKMLNQKMNNRVPQRKQIRLTEYGIL